MKLMIDTTDSEKVKIQCDKFNPYELGLALGRYISYIAEQTDFHAEELKVQVAHSIRTGIFKSDEETEIKEVRQGR